MVEDRSGRPDDAALVLAVASGSHDALAHLYDRHADAIFAAARRLTSDRGIAEEVVQDTFLALWDRASVYDPASGSLAAWLHAIARNRTVDRLRAAGRRPQSVGLPVGSAETDSQTTILERAAAVGTLVVSAPPPEDPELALATGETRAAIARALDGLGDEERTVIVLAYREELSQSEIAERLGWPLGTVKTRTRRALRRMRDAMDGGA